MLKLLWKPLLLLPSQRHINLNVAFLTLLGKDIKALSF
jgi:hypothetical protein